ncbi:MBL fold metallo-hydrolase [Paracoccus sp. (in: a-proteobacteria)]|nr:MBL fold metallo-hydrolase [Paracoccus sp. (in: a-proteobacteria)]
MPEFGALASPAEGVLWFRQPLPMKVGSVNCWLIEDHDGWALIDAGFGDAAGLDWWRDMLAGPLAGLRLSRLIVTHAHVDHIGAAGLICRARDIPLIMTAREWDLARTARCGPEPWLDDLYLKLGAETGQRSGIMTFLGHCCRSQRGIEHPPFPVRLMPRVRSRLGRAR